jgi:ABC-type transport system substrate-binding protein
VAALLPDGTKISAAAGDTVVVQLRAADAELPALAADPALAPVPPAASGAKAAAWAARPSGNGPFTLLEQPDSGGLVLSRNPRYSGRPAWLDAVSMRTEPDAQTAWLAFQEGQVSYAPVPAGQLAAAGLLAGRSEDERRQAGVVAAPAAALDVLGLNTTKAPFDTPERRLAASLAIDREALAALFDGARTPAERLVPDGLAGPAPAACDACAHDPGRAKQLLTEAGGAGAPATLTIAPEETDRAVASAVAADLRAAGFTVSVREAAGGGPGVLRGKAGAALRLASVPRAAPTVAGFLAAAYARAGSGLVTNAPDEELNSLLDKAAATADEEARNTLTGQAEARVAGQVAAIPLLQERRTAVLAPGVQGLDLTPLGLIDLSAASLLA